MGKQRRRFVANLEQMEGRLLMSAAPQYTIKDLGIASTDSPVTGINSLGQVIGEVYIGNIRYSYVTGPNGENPTPILDLPWANAFGINDLGQITGDNGNNGFIYSNGEITNISSGEYPYGTNIGYDINNSGNVSGSLWNYQQGLPDVMFYDGTVHDIGTLTGLPGGGQYGQARGLDINNSGQIAGYSYAYTTYSNLTLHAFLSDPNGGTLHDLGTLTGGTASWGFSVNDSGQVVGQSQTQEGGYRAFVSDVNGGTLHDLGVLPGFPGVNNSQADGINNIGEIVGYSWNTVYDPYGTNYYHAFVYIGGTMYDLNSLIPSDSGFSLTKADSINNNGQIAVAAIDSSGETHALLLTPVPLAPVAPTITWSNPADIVYGTPISSTQLNATTDVAGTFTYDVAEGTVLHAGAAQAIHATFTPTDTEHYTTATAEAFLNVTPAPLTVTANNVSRVWGQPNPTLSGTVTGLVNGDTDVATYTTTATINSPAGTYPITPALVDSNYDITLVPGTLTVTPVLTNTGVSFGAGVIRIDGTRDSGDNTEIHIDPTTGNVQVTLNGFIIQYVASSVTMIQYIGSPGGYDTFTNRTGVMSYVAASGNYNSFTSGPGVSVWQLYGIGNSIADDGGTNYVYRHGHAVTETGTGVFINMS